MAVTILVWGAGAIGGCIGAALIRAGEDVIFVDRDADHVAAIDHGGLAISGPVETYHVPARALLPQDVTGTFDRIFLAVKAHHTQGAVEALAPHLAPDGYVLSLQNGLNERAIAARIGAARTIGAFVNFGADYIEPGHIHYGGRGAVVVGELDGGRTQRIEALHALMLRFDERAILTPNIWGYLWSKLVYGALLFGTAVTNDSIADVLAMEEYRPVLTALAHEVLAVAAAEKVTLESFDGFSPFAFLPSASAAATAQSFDDMVRHNRRSAKSHSGIWRDLAVRKRKTEVDEQIGPVVSIGAQHGIATPITQALIARIHAIENGEAPLDLAGLDILRHAALGTNSAQVSQ